MGTKKPWRIEPKFLVLGVHDVMKPFLGSGVLGWLRVKVYPLWFAFSHRL